MSSRIIGVASGKGGVGKTSIAVNLAVSLKEFGAEATVVDADFDASNLGVHLGQYEHPVKIHDVLHHQSKAEEAIFRHSSGINAIVASNEIDRVEPDTDLLRHVLERAADDAEYVIVDCPPGLDSTVEDVIDACDEILVVTTPTSSAATNAAQIVQKAKRMHKPVLGTVVNMHEDKPDVELVDRELEMMTESDIVSKVPHDSKMKESLFHNTPLVKHEPISEAAIEIKDLAAALEGTQYEPPKFAGFKRKLKDMKDAVQR